MMGVENAVREQSSTLNADIRSLPLAVLHRAI
jgi:hypothetical protein